MSGDLRTILTLGLICYSFYHFWWIMKYSQTLTTFFLISSLFLFYCKFDFYTFTCQFELRPLYQLESFFYVNGKQETHVFCETSMNYYIMRNIDCWCYHKFYWEYFLCFRFFNFGVQKKRPSTPSPKIIRRHGSSSSDRDASSDISGESSPVHVAHHSFSTGNLQDLDSHKSSRTNSR